MSLLINAREAALSDAGSVKPEQAKALYQLLQRLVDLLADAPQQSRVANSKLARYAATLGLHQEAADVLERLLAIPEHAKNKDYLQRAARAQFLAGNQAASLEHWRRLLLGLQRGSEEWYEAKYYQLACLQKLDRERFDRAARQFRLLHPQLGPPAWRQKFARLLPK